MGADQEPRTPAYRYALAGLEAGMMAALAMLALLGSASILYRKSFWTSPNILASTFYGEAALRDRFSGTTFSGLAFYLLIYGVLGALFGLAIRDQRNVLRVMCIGILAAIAWYYFSFGVMWKRCNPLVVLYTHDRPMFAGHVLYGMLLARIGHYVRALQPKQAAPDVAGVTELKPQMNADECR